MTELEHKLIAQLERDIRNQVLIDRMKRLDWKGKLMVFARRYWGLGITAGMLVVFSIAVAHADPIQCPDPGAKCKILFLSEQEERALAGPNGVLDTAAQARALDLGQFAVYMKTRIAGAAQGEVKEVPKEEKK